MGRGPGEDLPKKGRRDVDATADDVPNALAAALHSLYSSYEKRFAAWESSDAATRGETPPVFIVVCNNTTVSKMVYDWIGGWERPAPGGGTAWRSGELSLLSNVVDGRSLDRPRTVLVDSQELESGGAMRPEFKQVAQREIEEFKSELAQRFPGRSVDDLTDEDLLREVMNTVGKPGRLGQHVRCVVSVSHAVPDRAALRITFPRLSGYRVELPDAPLVADFDVSARPRVTRDTLPTRTISAGLVGDTEVHGLDALRQVRTQRVAFEVARVLLESKLSTAEDPRPWYFPQLVLIVRHWLSEHVEYGDDCFPGLFLLRQNATWAAEEIWRDLIRYGESREPRVLPVFNPFEQCGDTDAVDFFTTRQVWPTTESLCPVNVVVLDGADGNAWERATAQAIESLPQVASYVKNDHLGFTIPYSMDGRTRQYVPDFLVRLKPADDGIDRTLVVEVSGGRKDQATRRVKADTARGLWVPAVNHHGGFGRWGFSEVDDPAVAARTLRAALDALGRD